MDLTMSFNNRYDAKLSEHTGIDIIDSTCGYDIQHVRYHKSQIGTSYHLFRYPREFVTYVCFKSMFIQRLHLYTKTNGIASCIDLVMSVRGCCARIVMYKMILKRRQIMHVQ
eukprot:186378_1